MEITYQGLRIVLPLDGVIQVEDFGLEASFNNHARVSLLLLMEEEGIEDSLCGLPEGAAVDIYEGDILFRGKVSSAKMVPLKGLHYLQLEAVAYTSEWDLKAVSQSFLNLDATYEQVMKKVLEDQPGADIIDCITGGAVIPDFLLQYEETDWNFLIRLASHFQSFLVPDYQAERGRVYFGIPDLGEEYALREEEYEALRDMDQYYHVNLDGELVPQEIIRWNIRTGQRLSLAQKVRLGDVSAIVTKVKYLVEDGALCRCYEISREKGCLSMPLKNPNIFGMSIPATVKQRSGNCVRVQMHIDQEYDTSPNVRYFTYAIESSLVYCMPELESQVHIYFPSDEESDAIAVHAIRTSSEGTAGAGASSGAGSSGGGYAQRPEYKSFSNVNGAELLLAPSFACAAADQDQATNIYMDTEGNVSITGAEISLDAEKNLAIGEPDAEDGEPAESIELYGDTVTVQIGEGEESLMELTEEARIIAAFVKLDASDTTPAEPSVELIEKQVTDGDAAAMEAANNGAAAQLVEKYEAGRKKILDGVLKIATVAVAVVATIATGGAALAIAATVVAGAVCVGFAVADITEGISDVNGAQSGNLDQSFNFLRDTVFGGDQDKYDFAKMVSDVVFGAVSGGAVGDAIGCLGRGSKLLKMGVQITGNVFDGVVHSLIDTGTVNMGDIALNVTLGLVQGFIGSSATDGIMGLFGNKLSNLVVKHVVQGTVGTAVDTFLDWGFSTLTGREFNLAESLALNATANFIGAFTSDPVDSITGSYYLNTTDFILTSIPCALTLERTYRSTNRDVSCLGMGWNFPYGSRIYRDTKDAEHARIHMQTITGHSLCYEKQDDMWVSQTRGTSRFLLEVREENTGLSGQETFLLTDVVGHTLCAYDRQGLLRYVEYPNSQRLAFDYDEGGLSRITTPLGNKLEVQCRGGRILQITDEIGRRTQYRYEGDYLADVVNTDEGITHYEYDENGHIISVTDQNGNRYLENEYDERGRVTRQTFASGIYQTFTYDDGLRRNTVHFSETGKTEVYEYNEQLLQERLIYEDGTCKAFAYSEDNLKISETSRLGHETAWEYDAFGRTVKEQSPDGFAVCHEYNENHDLVRTWDSDGRETQNVYDHDHNLILVREKISDNQWRETAKEYDFRGRCILERDALGNVTRMEYEADHVRPGRVITPKGEETAYEYDRVGRRMSVGNSYGIVEFSYNSRNLITKRTDGEGYTSHSLYDNMGNLTAYYPPRQWENKEGGYEYRMDFLGRVVDAISPLGEHRKVFRSFDGDITRAVHPVSYAEKGESGEGTRFEYDHDGNCIRICSADGGVERRFYDADGNMVKQVMPEDYNAESDDGRGFCYDYDRAGRLIQAADLDGNVLYSYEYNGHGQVLRITDGEGRETLYAYDGLGRKTRQQTSVRREGDVTYYRVIAYTYDAQGNKTEEAYGLQETVRDGEPKSWHRIRFSYDQNNHLTLVQDEFGARMRYDYDCLGNVILEERLIEEGIQSRIRYQYNKNGWRIQKAEEIQGNGAVNCAITGYQYDSNGNLTSIRTPKGFEIRRKYDADDRLVEQRTIDRKNGIDCKTRYTYDAAGNIQKWSILGKDGEKLETDYRYDLKDRLTHTISPAGAVTRYFYDQNDRLLKEIGPYGYDKETDSGAGTGYAYDSRGNRIRVTNGLGELVQELSYNLQNLPVMEKDAFGNQTDIIYETDGLIKEVRRDVRANHGRQPIQQYEYNARGQIVGIIDGNLEKVAYDVDSWGRITGVGFSDGVKEGYEYTPAGQVSRTVDGNGNSVQYHYNSLGKVCERIDQMGQKETFQYDEEGKLALHVDRDGRQLQRIYNVFGNPVYEKATDSEGGNPNISTWHYDSLGRVIRAVCDGHSYEYEYDEQGNLKEKRSNGKRLISFTYDTAGQITEIKDPAGICTCYEYDILGRRSRIYNDQGLDVRYGYDCMDRVQKISYGNGVETAYTYDANGSISSLETKIGRETLLSFTYQYDGNGNRTAKVGTQCFATEGNNALDISYQYDVRGQLLEEQRNGISICYAYDKAGNRVRKTDTEGETTYCYNAKNQLLHTDGVNGKKRFTYDGQGGIVREETSSGARCFTYNSKHQQVRVETENGDVQENLYDAEGLRYELLENRKSVRFVYHNGELLHEKGGDENKTSYHLGAGIDAFQRGQQIQYYHRDEQLSTVVITDDEGVVCNSYQYDAFGMELQKAEQLPNRIRYASQQYDNLTEQYYLRARYYNPIVGRFIQEDVYQGDGLGLYVYCNNNPVIYFDPSGYYKAEGGLFADKVTNYAGDSTSLKLAMLEQLTGTSFSSATVGSHQAQHLIPQSCYQNPIVAVSGYQVDHAENGIFDINMWSKSPDALDNFLRDYTVSPENRDYYISNNTHHGYDGDNSYNHEAYSRYVNSRLDELNVKYDIYKRLETSSLEELRLELVSTKEMDSIRQDITQLNHELRSANQEGIDLYLKNNYNQSTKDYTQGGTLTKEEAYQRYLEENFNGRNNDGNEEGLKSKACGGAK